MDYYFTYQQQDTFKVKSLKDISSQVKLPVTLTTRPKLISSEKLQIDSSLIQKREVEKPVTTQPTVQNNITRRREQVGLSDSSKFVKPQTEVKISTVIAEPAKEIILPERKVNNTNFDWITILLLTTLVIFATLRNPFAGYITNLFKSTVNYPTSTRMFRDRSYSLMDGAFRLDVLFYFVFSLFVYQSLIHLDIDMPVLSFKLFLLCIAEVMAYFVLKRIIYLTVGFVNSGTPETLEYLFNLNNYNRVLGLLLFPIVTLIAFSPFFNPVFFVILGLILIVFFYGMSLQRGILILMKKQFSIFYLFLYLCTLEFLPLFLIYKMVLM